MNLTLIAIACGVIAVIYGIITSRQVLAASPGNQRMVDIASAIQEGAQAYLGRQYTTIGIVGVAVAVLVGVFLGVTPAVAFTVGALLSGAAGYIGMNISVRANVRTAERWRSGQSPQARPDEQVPQHRQRIDDHRDQREPALPHALRGHGADGGEQAAKFCCKHGCIPGYHHDCHRLANGATNTKHDRGQHRGKGD